MKPLVKILADVSKHILIRRERSVRWFFQAPKDGKVAPVSVFYVPPPSLFPFFVLAFFFDRMFLLRFLVAVFVFFLSGSLFFYTGPTGVLITKKEKHVSGKHSNELNAFWACTEPRSLYRCDAPHCCRA